MYTDSKVMVALIGAEVSFTLEEYLEQYVIPQMNNINQCISEKNNP